MYYKVRWEGYQSEEDSWEPMENLITCQELVDKYWELRKEGYKKRGRKPVSILKWLKLFTGHLTSTEWLFLDKGKFCNPQQTRFILFDLCFCCQVTKIWQNMLSLWPTTNLWINYCMGLVLIWCQELLCIQVFEIFLDCRAVSVDCWRSLKLVLQT